MHCRSDPFVLCRQICLTSINAVSAAAVNVAASRLVSRLGVWVWGSRSVGCLACLRYVSSEFESRSQHQVCPRCVDGAVVSATLGHSSLGQLQDWGQGQRATTPGKRTTLETLVLSVSCYSQAALYQILRIRFECAGGI